MNTPNPPRVNWRTHLSLGLLALVYIFSYIDRQVISILIEPIKQEFGASDTQIGLLTGIAFGLLYALMGIPLGRLADRSNRRNIIAISCTLWSLATMACGMAAQFWQLLAARMAVAIGEAGGMAPSISLVSDLYPPKRRSLVISLFMMGPHLGVLIGLALGGWIAQNYGWRTTFIAFGIPGIVLGPLVWLLVREPRRGGFDAPKAGPVAATEPLWTQVRRLLAISAFRNVALACGMAGVAGYGYGIWTPSFLVRTHGLSIAHAGLMFGVASGVGAVGGALFSGALCDRLTPRDVRWQIGLPLIGVALSVPTALTFLLWPTGSPWVLGPLLVPKAMVFAMLFGFFASWWAALSYSAVSQMIATSERTVAAALLNLFITLLGVGVGPLVTGVFSDLLTPRFGADALRWALVAVVLLFLLTVLFFALAVNPYREQLARNRETE
ncbi:MFS transporter [Rhodoferax sp.]|uniref:spinster family MFS transporter n=1 Tax=Rhodoferax sp. TaxID=50421 RepID=UPI0027279C3C|nr:MFS transporter [Rhodoferax sp.]MDO9145613.1 MFS transporter [Rhodoferax sp.]